MAVSRSGKAQRQLQGVIVRLASYGDSDRIVELLTPDEGRISLIARGARASKKRFAGALDLFVSVEANVVSGSGLWTLTGVDVRSLRLGVRESLDRIGRASLLCDCARALSAERQEAPQIYAALCRALDCLDQGDLIEATAAYGEILEAAGILPDLSAGYHGQAQRFLLDYELGALVPARTGGGRSFGRGVLLALSREKAPSEREALELEHCVVDWVQAQVGKPLVSADVYLRAL